MILLIGGEKGGSGKSTLAGNLAVALARRGVDVLLLDADPQGTASKWVARRTEAGHTPAVHCAQKTGDVATTARELAGRYGLVIIDAGGRDSRELRSAMLAASLMLLPLQASQADLETLPRVDELIGMARAMNPALQVRAVLTRTPTNPQITEAAEARALLGEFAAIELATAAVRDRKVYRDTWLSGQGVVEADNPKAREEIEALLAEIFEEAAA